MAKTFHLVYMSHAAEDISYTDIRDILDISRKNNASEGVTGLLIFRESYFLQLLEGDERSVKKILGKIMMDDRNHTLKVLIETSSDKRLFSSWAMAFVDGDISSNSTQELVDLFNTCEKHDKNNIIPMLEKFRASAPDLK
ncbi:BLUF domain-containing protein [Bdellovibrio sp. 22V]|uniref:BLUF domain-containing protein n=1 Tax=Bdellovibrio TaxID=958 RepID=UPI002543D39B|nr:BLUF domain-containing protein [Bdellovibrio sp. 22V]WII73508.1 BLUF domain-containing protein [Bdellovibrio sp. 22V]